MRKSTLLISLITLALSAGAAFAKGPGSAGGGQGYGTMSGGGTGMQQAGMPGEQSMEQARKRKQDGSGAMHEYRTMEQNQVQPRTQTQMKSMGTPPDEALKQQEQIRLQDQLQIHRQ